MTEETIAAVLAAKREQHPELAAPLRWPGFRRLLARENIALYVRALGRPAQLVNFDGAWAILINANTPPRRHTYFGAHELAHLWLHHDPLCDRAEVCYNMDTDWPDDPREDEAEFLAACLLGGPQSY